MATNHSTPYVFNALWTAVLTLNLMGIGWLLEKYIGLLLIEAIRFTLTGATIFVSNGIWLNLLPDLTACCNHWFGVVYRANYQRYR
ncbi:hypothetical protein [Endozoicomonas sp.]|uniref:hypothetical protein n=1 Tax=Endozoicomonas sp. TaxID=1892382 RepID=UPI002886D579|nr:hypothetical protein [Endozoicomonas sp.]